MVVAHGMTCEGIEGCRFPTSARVEADPSGTWILGRVTRANATEARRIWSLVDGDYVPIDWHLDSKSGFRWDELTWYRHIKIGDPRCADVKVPWELGRMQHLPQLAFAATLAHENGDNLRPPAEYKREFRNEVLDFIATNPPRFGVNWVAAMDVAIRVANWLLAYDLFVAGGTRFDAEFEAIFARSVFEHGRHIAANLEWSRRRGNHYLADVVGLIIVAVHLPRGREVDSWLATGSRELIAEIDRQFLDDGGNFESSACYHRLSAELVAYGLAALLGLEEERRPTLPEHLADRLRGMADFVIGITKPDGRVPQVGDNDNSRLFKFVPITRTDSAGRQVEDHLDLRHLVAAVDALAPDPAYGAFAAGHELETEIVRALAGGRTLGPHRRTGPVSRPSRHDPLAIEELDAWIAARPPRRRRAIDIPLPSGALNGLGLTALPDFGLYVARSPRLYFAIRCGTSVSWAPTGHLHNDQLSLELTVDGSDLIRDPGSYVYTPLPELRNAYRSAAAHFGPRPADGEPARLDAGLFTVPDPPAASCLSWGESGFAGRSVLSNGRQLAATVRWTEGALVIRWGSAGCDLAGPADGADWRAWLTDLPFSPGYGIIEA